jgi:hypothetical protein
MTNRRVDAIYFLMIFGACAIGFFLSNRASDEPAPSVLPDLSPPSLILEEPDLHFDFGFLSAPSYAAPEMPQLHHAGKMEWTLLELRTALLKTSVPKEIDQPERVVASLE